MAPQIGLRCLGSAPARGRALTVGTIVLLARPVPHRGIASETPLRSAGTLRSDLAATLHTKGPRPMTDVPRPPDAGQEAGRRTPSRIRKRLRLRAPVALTPEALAQWAQEVCTLVSLIRPLAEAQRCSF